MRLSDDFDLVYGTNDNPLIVSTQMYRDISPATALAMNAHPKSSATCSSTCRHDSDGDRLAYTRPEHVIAGKLCNACCMQVKLLSG